MKIPIKYHAGAIRLEQHGNWIDLFPRRIYHFKAPSLAVTPEGEQYIEFDSQMIDLGISMHLPKHFEAVMTPRSSTFSKQGLIQSNHYGVIDGGTEPGRGIDYSDKIRQGYTGQEDVWRFPAIAMRKTSISPSKAIAQFSIRPSMNAPVWVKLKWLFTSSIDFITVDVLHSVNRGSTGVGVLVPGL